MEFAWKNTCNNCRIKVPFYKYKKFIGLPFYKILSNLKIKKKKFQSISKNYNHYSTKKNKLVKFKKKNIKFLQILKKKRICSWTFYLKKQETLKFNIR